MDSDAQDEVRYHRTNAQHPSEHEYPRLKAILLLTRHITYNVRRWLQKDRRTLNTRDSRHSDLTDRSKK